MSDPYQVLGLSRGASADDIKRAYRRLAKTHHPDAPGADPRSRARFHEITEAYRTLTRPGGEPANGNSARAANTRKTKADAATREKAREAYSKKEEAAEAPTREQPKAEPKQQDKPKEEPKPRAEKPEPRTQTAQPREDDDEDEKSGRPDFVEALRRAGTRAFGRRGADTSCTLAVPFLEAARGGTHRVTMPNGRVLDVRLPAGIADGRQIRLRGQGEPGSTGGEAGDALVTIAVEPHPYFSREGDDIRLALPVSIREAVEGAQVRVPTVEGTVSMSIPPNSNSGRVLRLAGKGLTKADGSRGHQFVELVVVLPEKPDPALTAFVRGWDAGRSQNPRAEFGLD